MFLIPIGSPSVYYKILIKLIYPLSTNLI